MKIIKIAGYGDPDWYENQVSENIEKINSYWTQYKNTSDDLNPQLSKSMILSGLVKTSQELIKDSYQLERTSSGYKYGVSGVSTQDIENVFSPDEYGYFNGRYWLTAEGFEKLKDYVERHNEESDFKINLDIQKWS